MLRRIEGLLDAARWKTKRTGAEIVRGYLEAFEPDFIVTGDGIEPSRFAAAQGTTFPLETMSNRDGLASRGMTAMPIYRHRQEQELRFVQRNAVPLRLPVSSDLWIAAAFGAFPGGELDVFEKAYRQLGAEEKYLDGENYLDTLLFAYSPLNFTNNDLERTCHSRYERTYMLLDGRDWLDVIDFWNLRALGWNVIPVPVAWASILAPRISALRLRAEIHLLKARSVDDAAFGSFTKSIKASKGLHLQDWYPRLWEPDLHNADNARGADGTSDAYT